MMVWIPESEAAGRPAPFPTAATTATVTTSGRKDPRMVNDGEDPPNSSDNSSYFDWWPVKGTTEWVEYAFPGTVKVGQVEGYWFDDTGQGEVRVPASWRLFYRDGATWKPVEAKGEFGTAKDTYDAVTFQPVTTTGMLLEVTMQPGWSAGLQEWKVQ